MRLAPMLVTVFCLWAGLAYGDCTTAPTGCAPEGHVQVMPGHSAATGGAVREQGFGRYTTDTGVTLRDTGLGRLKGGGVTLRYQGRPPLRAQKRRSCRTRATGTIICF